MQPNGDANGQAGPQKSFISCLMPKRCHALPLFAMLCPCLPWCCPNTTCAVGPAHSVASTFGSGAPQEGLAPAAQTDKPRRKTQVIEPQVAPQQLQPLPRRPAKRPVAAPQVAPQPKRARPAPVNEGASAMPALPGDNRSAEQRLAAAKAAMARAAPNTFVAPEVREGSPAGAAEPAAAPSEEDAMLAAELAAARKTKKPPTNFKRPTRFKKPAAGGAESGASVAALQPTNAERCVYCSSCLY